MPLEVGDDDQTFSPDSGTRIRLTSFLAKRVPDEETFFRQLEAGVVNDAGNVMGLMPHPEHAVDPLGGSTDGGLLFESAARVPAAA